MEFLTNYYKVGGNADAYSEEMSHVGLVTESGATHQVPIGKSFNAASTVHHSSNVHHTPDAQAYMRTVGGAGNRTAADYEQELLAIFNRSGAYRKQIENEQNNTQMHTGGRSRSMNSDSDKPKKSLPDTVRLMLDISKKIKQSDKYSDIPQKHLMKIAKIIVNDAKKQTNNTTVNDEVKALAMKLADNPAKYVDQFKKEQESEPASASANTRGKKSSRSNDRSHTSYNWANADNRRHTGMY